MLTLYMAPGSSSMAPHIALHEAGALFRTVPVSFANREHKSAAYLRINPEGKVPTLLIGEKPLTEAAAILYFVARRYPAANLLPPHDPESQAHAIAWMSFIASTLHPARRAGLEHAMRVYAIADVRLGPKTWALAEYSIADIHLFRLYWRFVHSLRPDPYAFPNLNRHYDRMMEREAVKRVLEIEARIGYELPP